MKKIEAQELAPWKSQLIIEYIEQILSDDECVNGKFNFSCAKIDNEMMLTLDMYVPKTNFERHLKLGITSDHSLVLYEQLLNDLLDKFLEHETMGVSRFYSIKSVMGKSFSGINAINSIGSNIAINLNGSGLDFNEIVSRYNHRIQDYILSIQNDISVDESPKLR